MDVPKLKSPSRRLEKKYYPYIAGAIATLIVFLIIPTIVGGALPVVDRSKLWISPVTEGEFVSQVRGVGTLVTVDYRWITAESSGLVEKVLIKPGASVEADSVLVVLSNPLLEQELAQTKWELEVAEAELVAFEARLEDESLQHKFQIEKAGLDLQSAKAIEAAKTPLVERGVISQLDYLSARQVTLAAKAQLKMLHDREPILEKSLQAQLLAGKAQVEKMSNNLESVQHRVAQLEVKAGMSGVLQELTVEEGERADIGVNIARVARPEPLLAELNVQEVQAKDIHVGLSAEIDTRNGTAKGRVIRVDPRVSDGKVQVDVEIEEKLPAGARPDLSITGTIQVEYIANTLYIDRPGTAAAGEEAQLFVLNDAGTRAVRKEILLGRASTNHIEVLTNLVSGDKVVVSDTSDFHQYSQIKIK